MRITNNMMVQRVLRNITNTAERLTEYHGQLSSGRRLEVPSDDPVGVGTALRLRAGIQEVTRYRANVDDGIGWAESTDAALGHAVDILQRARELAVAGANDTLAQPSRDALAREIDQLLEQLVQVGNTTHNGRYIFAGFQTMSPPFTLQAGPPRQVVYNGDGGQMYREIGAGVTVSLNLTGEDVFGLVDKGTPNERVEVFDILIRLADDLRAGNTAAVGSARLGELDVAIDRMLAYRSEVGAKINRLELSRNRLQDAEVNLGRLLSQTEDADMARTIIKLKTEESAYQVGLAAGARIIQPTLLDFLK